VAAELFDLGARELLVERTESGSDG
jgi:hypothetical protein